MIAERFRLPIADRRLPIEGHQITRQLRRAG